MPKWVAALVVAMVLAAGCGGASTDAASGPEAGSTQLECEIEGYPCSLAEVPVEVLDRMDTLSDEVVARFAAGATRSDVDSWLGGLDDMAEVESDEDAVWFRLEGGRGTWVLRASALGTRGAPSRSTPIASSPPRQQPHFRVVGEPIEKKQALVLSPMLWDFGPTDEGPEVTAILAATRGYETGVTFAANETANSSKVSIGSFEGWDKKGFDVVHVVSHGTRICKKSPCRAAIAASTLIGAVPDAPGVEVRSLLRRLRQRGVDLAKAEGQNRGFDLLVPLVFLTADFFRDQYPHGLQEAVVFFNACETFGNQATDLGDVIRGDKSVFFGWSEKVDSDSARDAALLLYEQLAEGGYPAHQAWERVGVLRIDPVVGGQLMIGERTDGDDLRIRDVVELLDPGSGELLSRASSVPIIGSRGDGEPDSVPYAVRVDGMLPEFAADVILHVSVDGEEIAPQPITNGQVNEKDQWTVTGTAPLGFDLEEDTTMNFRAWVELYSGGESDDETPAAVVGGPIMGLEWVMEARSIINLTGGPRLEGRAELILEFEQGQAFDEPHPRYVVTGGTVTYDARNAEMLGCTYSANARTFNVTAGMSPPARTDGFASSVLVFDTTVDPIEYHGVIYTQGAEDVVVQSCPESGTNNVSYGNSVSWMIVDPSDHRVARNRRLIEGFVRHAENHTITWKLTRTK